MSALTRSALAILTVGASLAVPARAATLAAATCSRTEVQQAVDRAADGDLVTIPAGDCAWPEPVAWDDKSITVLGRGPEATRIACQECFRVRSTVPGSEHSGWRIAALTLHGSAPGGTVITIWDNVATSHSGWRIDHVRFEYPGAGSGYGIFVGGPTFGLVDHTDWRWGNGLCIIVAAQRDDEYPGSTATPQGGWLASQPLGLGTERALFVEDSTFTCEAPGGCAAYDTSSGGGRCVFRHNRLAGAMYYSHWTRNVEIGDILHEIYRNAFSGNAAYGAYPIRLEAGTGVIFDNTVRDFAGNHALLDERRGFLESDGPFGACDGQKPWDGNAGDPAAPGWPCLGQIGRAPGRTMAELAAGRKQESAPLWIWNNGPEDGCRTGGSCSATFGAEVYGGAAGAAYVRADPHPNGEVDYVVGGTTPRPAYAPYAYPHPLQAAGPAAPDDPAPARARSSGCGCGVAPHAALGPGALLLLLARRRRAPFLDRPRAAR